MVSINSRPLLRQVTASRAHRASINGVRMNVGVSEIRNDEGNTALLFLEIPPIVRKQIGAQKMLDRLHGQMSQILAARVLSSKKINFGKQALPDYELQYIDRETGEMSYARVYCIQVYIIAIIIDSNSSDDRKAVADQVYACFRWKIDPYAPENQLPEENEQATPHQLILALQRPNLTVHVKVLERLENAKGGEYTMALDHSLERFSGIKQNQIKAVLERRMLRMKSTTLIDYLVDSLSGCKRRS